MEHIALLGILIVLIVATWVAAYIRHHQQSYSHAILRPLFHYCIFYAVAVMFALMILYVKINLPADYFEDKLAVFHELPFLVVTLFEIGLIYSMIRIYLGFKDKDIPGSIKNWIIIGMTVFIISYGIKMAFPVESPLFHGLDFFQDILFDNIIVVEIVILVVMLVTGKKETDRKRIKLRRSFAWLFLARYIILTLLFVLFVALLHQKGEVIPRSIRYPTAVVFVLFFSLAPFIWIRFFFRKYAESMLVIVEDKQVLDLIYKKYNISNREQDIMKLILDGKTNKEIEDALFISYHTVKNHVYNLYQKLGVKNRYDLVHFITKFRG
jgi:DNA-binding CsgD family transcriptional regulator